MQAGGILGAGLFLTLFGVYVWSLRYAELGLVTLGWVVILQVGVLVLDHVRYGVQLPTTAWAAVAVMLAAQAVLLFTVRAPGG